MPKLSDAWDRGERGNGEVGLKKEARLAVKALKKARQKIAFDANLHKLGVVTPYTIRCAKEYADISAAIAALEKPDLRQAPLPGFEGTEDEGREKREK